MMAAAEEDGDGDLDGVVDMHFPNGWLSSHPPQRALRGGYREHKSFHHNKRLMNGCCTGRNAVTMHLDKQWLTLAIA